MVLLTSYLRTLCSIQGHRNFSCVFFCRLCSFVFHSLVCDPFWGKFFSTLQAQVHFFTYHRPVVSPPRLQRLSRMCWMDFAYWPEISWSNSRESVSRLFSPTHPCVLSIVPGCLDCCSFVVSLEVRQCELFSFVLFQNCFGGAASGSFSVSVVQNAVCCPAGVLAGIASNLLTSLGEVMSWQYCILQSRNMVHRSVWVSLDSFLQGVVVFSISVLYVFC